MDKTAENQSAKIKQPHKLELDNHRALSVTGVAAVPVFTDRNLTVRLQDETLLITGHDLSVKNLDVENGKLNVTGYVTSMRYTASSTPSSVIKKIFK